MTLRERFDRKAKALLRRHSIKHLPLDRRYWRESMAYANHSITAPWPVDSRTFCIFAHELAHVVLDHMGTYDWGWREIEADLWAMKQLAAVKGRVPITVSRDVARNAGRILRRAASGCYVGRRLDLGGLVAAAKAGQV